MFKIMIPFWMVVTALPLHPMDDVIFELSLIVKILLIEPIESKKLLGGKINENMKWMTEYIQC